jgi:hypothetical protein
MRCVSPLALTVGVLVALGGAPAQASTFGVEGTGFVVTDPAGQRLTSTELVGAVFEIADGLGGHMKVRIDAVAPAKENTAILLHNLSVADPATGAWRPMCDADAYGRAAGFPVRGRWDDREFVADPSTWFLTCTSGSQGKCVLWGYDPWGAGPDGRPLADFYRACQQMVRADYAGKGEPHTRDGTAIDTADVLGVQAHETLNDPAFAFEAGWGVKGAVCVARTRWPDLLSRDALLAAEPALKGPCDEAAARARGALLFTRVAVP